MTYRSLHQCVHDLEAAGRLVRIEQEVDPRMEAAEIHRRVFEVGGPAVYFARLKGTPFPAVSNLFGTLDRVRFIFRDSLAAVERLVRMKLNPGEGLRHPLQGLRAARSAWHMLPKRVRRGPVLKNQTTIDRLPAIQSWPRDGGAFILLPQVYTEDAAQPGWRHSNLGMYRIQLNGGQYEPNAEIGLHYQIHRGIGVHHAAAVREGKPFHVNIFVGGPPAMAVAAVMPLPEGMSELMFAGALNRRRARLVHSRSSLPIHAEADFCITGTVVPDKLLPEGPFGDHLGYYSLRHDFPVLRVEQVFHRDDAIWPFTIVGRPPQEDTMFGKLIHEITGPVIPTVVPGVRQVHAVDAAGVHPLLLAVGSERYAPYLERTRPMELLTQASGIMGQGQMSLAKYLLIAAADDDPRLDANDIEAFFAHLLARVDWRRDLHFHTCTTIDTLDYSSGRLNEGSKVVIAAAGKPIRELPTQITGDLRLPAGFTRPRLCLPGVLAVEGPPLPRLTWDDPASPAWSGGVNVDPSIWSGAMESFCSTAGPDDVIRRFPLIVVVDDSELAARSLRDFLWITFTRSNPAADVYGIDAFVEQKHWGCRGPLVIDARLKPHQPPPLESDPEVARRVEKLAAPGGPLHGII
jgi:4-hydroxy-3-polyprenylbenzoate decarboxylase